MTTLETATSTLIQHYDRAATADTSLLSDASLISRSDLEAIAESNDPAMPQELREAARFLLGSEVARNYLDVAAGKGGPVRATAGQGPAYLAGARARARPFRACRTGHRGSAARTG